MPWQKHMRRPFCSSLFGSATRRFVVMTSFPPFRFSPFFLMPPDRASDTVVPAAAVGGASEVSSGGGSSLRAGGGRWVWGFFFLGTRNTSSSFLGFM